VSEVNNYRKLSKIMSTPAITESMSLIDLKEPLKILFKVETIQNMIEAHIRVNK